jgi:hypothetical protein
MASWRLAYDVLSQLPKCPARNFWTISAQMPDFSVFSAAQKKGKHHRKIAVAGTAP